MKHLECKIRKWPIDLLAKPIEFDETITLLHEVQIVSWVEEASTGTRQLGALSHIHRQRKNPRIDAIEHQYMSICDASFDV